MSIYFIVAIVLLGSASYFVGFWQMIKGQYRPSTFSRIIWTLLAVNGFFGVYLSGGSTSSILLASIYLVGSIIICITSFWRGVNIFGKTEYVCLLLLAISFFIWLFFNAPFVNLVLSLIANLVGGIPTYKKVWLDPKSESVGFWSLFFFASLLSVFATESYSLRSIIFPVFFTLFDGSLMLLSLRKYSSARFNLLKLL
jgi:hypothetical protein